jgi:hypothetical protein
VQTPDDEQFEAYLKRFHPIAPAPVPTLSVGHSSRRSPSLGIWLAAVAAILVIGAVIGAVILHIRGSRMVVSNKASDAVVAGQHAPAEPLTMRSANAWLATAPSFKAAVDDLAFRSQTSRLPQGKQSAVAVLSKEKIRL